VTRQSTEDIPVPDHLADVLRRAAAGVPAAPPSLDEVRQRHRARQRQRSFAVVAGVGVLAAASIATPRLLAGPLGSPTAVDPTPSVAAAPAQRLLLEGQTWIVGMVEGAGEAALPAGPDPAQPNFGYPPGSVGVVQAGPHEVTADGEVVPLDLPGPPNRGLAVLSDGRIVALEWDSPSDPQPGDDRCDRGLMEYLRVYDADGTRLLSREVPEECAQTVLAGASETEVYLIRVPYDGATREPTTGRRLIAHNLADGSERTVADLDALPAHVDSRDVNVRAGLIAAVGDSYGCQAQVLDFDTGVVTVLDVTTLIADCRYVDQIRLSPDGGRLALAYRTGPIAEEPYEAGFAVIDLAGPALRLREIVQSVPSTAMASGPWGGIAVEVYGGNRSLTFSRYYPAGIAWSDDATVRLAWVWLPDQLDRVVGVDEVVTVRTFTVA
jgi:hypothetical protein